MAVPLLVPWCVGCFLLHGHGYGDVVRGCAGRPGDGHLMRSGWSAAFLAAAAGASSDEGTDEESGSREAEAATPFALRRARGARSQQECQGDSHEQQQAQEVPRIHRRCLWRWRSDGVARGQNGDRGSGGVSAIESDGCRQGVAGGRHGVDGAGDGDGFVEATDGREGQRVGSAATRCDCRSNRHGGESEVRTGAGIDGDG